MKINSKKILFDNTQDWFSYRHQKSTTTTGKNKNKKGKLSLITFNLWMEIFLMPHDKSGNWKKKEG